MLSVGWLVGSWWRSRAESEVIVSGPFPWHTKRAINIIEMSRKSTFKWHNFIISHNVVLLINFKDTMASCFSSTTSIHQCNDRTCSCTIDRRPHSSFLPGTQHKKGILYPLYCFVYTRKQCIVARINLLINFCHWTVDTYVRSIKSSSLHDPFPASSEHETVRAH